MYCSSCGVAVAPGLSYCNYCGEKLSGTRNDRLAKSPEVKPETLVAAMVFIFVFGLGAITVLMGVMKELHFDYGPIVAFTLLSFLIMLSLEGVIIRLLFRRPRGAEEADNAPTLKGSTTRELDAAQARALPEPIPSVTEHTTRAFDPIYTERTSK
jgi:hypothetical protein